MTRRPSTPAGRAGFTLIELLVVVSIIAVLSGLGYAGTRAAMQQAAKTREISAAKTLITAYAAYPADNNGALMAGHDAAVGMIELPNGDALSGPAAQRYPFRLAQYFDYQLKGTILVNRNATQVDESNHYMVSLYPALGMNYQFVGGSRSNTGTGASTDCITNISQASSSPIVFISAANGEPGKDAVDGYCTVDPPNLTGTNWKGESWTKESSAKKFGHVDARYGGKAVCAFLDGAVKIHTMEELGDMRLWSHQAAAADNPNYTVKAPTGGGGRR